MFRWCMRQHRLDVLRAESKLQRWDELHERVTMQEWNLFRRAMRRAIADTDQHANFNADGYAKHHADRHSDFNSNEHPNRDADGDADGNADQHPNSHANSDTDAHHHTDRYSDLDADQHPNGHADAGRHPLRCGRPEYRRRPAGGRCLSWCNVEHDRSVGGADNPRRGL